MIVQTGFFGRGDLFRTMGVCGLTGLVTLAGFATRAYAQQAGPSIRTDDIGEVRGATDSELSPPKTADAGADSSDKARGQDSGWDIRIYPVYAWAPIMGVNVTLPEIPGADSASGLLNGAAFAAFEIEKSRWSGTGSFLWAGLDAERQTPFFKVSTDLVWGQVMGGYEVVRDLTLQAGVRRMALDISVDLEGLP